MRGEGAMNRRLLRNKVSRNDPKVENMIYKSGIEVYLRGRIFTIDK